jgi:hypothetical protein
MSSFLGQGLFMRSQIVARQVYPSSIYQNCFYLYLTVFPVVGSFSLHIARMVNLHHNSSRFVGPVTTGRLVKGRNLEQLLICIASNQRVYMWSQRDISSQTTRGNRIPSSTLSLWRREEGGRGSERLMSLQTLGLECR